MSIALNTDSFATKLQELLNNEQRVDFGLLSSSGSPVSKNTDFEYVIFSDAGEYKGHTRSGNIITRYINGELMVISSDVVGTSEATASAVVQMRLELIIPMLGARKSNNALLNAVRDHIGTALRFANQSYVKDNEQVYLQVVDFEFATTGIRDQIPGVGDAITLSMYITYSYVMCGIASDGIKIYLVKDGEEILIPYSKLGISRKLVSEANVFSNDSSNANVPITRNLPTSTVLTINMDLLARLTAFDEAMRNFRLYGTIETLHIKVKEIKGTKVEENAGTEEKYVADYATADFDMMLDLAALNSEQDAVSSTTVTLVERSF